MRATSSYLDTNGGGGGGNSSTSHILDKSGAADHSSHHLHHHLHSAGHNVDTDSIVMAATTADKSDMDGHHVEMDAKSISSNKSAGSAQDR